MPDFNQGDVVSTTHLRRDVVGTFLGAIPDSHPSASSTDLLCRVRIGELIYLRRLSELRLAPRDDVNPKPAAPTTFDDIYD